MILFVDSEGSYQTVRKSTDSSTQLLPTLASERYTIYFDIGRKPGHDENSLYNVDPLKPHFFVVKLGFTGVYIIFLFLLKNINCG